MTGVLINHAMPSSEILTISTPIRGVNYLAVGALLGWFPARYHEDRDEALRLLADTLAGVLGADSDLARVGAEELAVLTPCDSLEQAAQLAVRLERTLCESGALVTFGCGVPTRGRKRSHAYRAADEHLYARRVLREPRAHVPHAVGA